MSCITILTCQKWIAFLSSADVGLISVGRIVFKSCIDSMKASKSIITLLKDFRKSSIRFINQSWMKNERKEEKKRWRKKKTKTKPSKAKHLLDMNKWKIMWLDCHTN